MSSPVRGNLFIISAPSGAGKTSLVKALLAGDPTLRASVSHTTRPPRPGERDGMDYYFVDQATFQAMLRADEFLEHARVFDHDYGTSREWVETRLVAGEDVILEIDWQGARQALARMPDGVGVFILPPSRASLETRLRQRGQDSPAVIAHRMSEALNEIRHYSEFDYLIVNDEFAQALDDMRALVRAGRLRRECQQQRQALLLKNLLGEI